METSDNFAGGQPTDPNALAHPAPLALARVPFRGGHLLAAQLEGEIWVPIRPVCDALGLAWQGQLAKLRAKPWATNKMILSVGADGKARQLADVEGEPGAAPPAPLSLSRRHRWLAIDTRNALENATELFELFDLVVSTLEPEKQRVAVSDALSILRSVRRLMWRLSADMRGVSGHLTGLSCEDSLGTHVAQLASLEAYGDSDEARARFLRDAIEAFTS